MLICRNAEGVHGQKKVGNLWSIVMRSICKIVDQGNRARLRASVKGDNWLQNNTKRN